MIKHTLARLFRFCPMCTEELKPHPSIDDAQWCENHGDFFVMQTRGAHPLVVFRPFLKNEPDVREETLDTTINFTTKTHSRVSMPHRIQCVETKEIFPSVKEAARVMGIDRTTIFKHLKDERRRAGGFHFKSLRED